MVAGDMQDIVAAEVQDLAAAFAQLYGRSPHAVARAPGRVNIIGEHIDYEGYGVLPMAIRPACLVAISWQQDLADQVASADAHDPSAERQQQQQLSMQVANVDSQRFPPATLVLGGAAAGSPSDSPRWTHYIHAAARGCLEFAQAEGRRVPREGTMQLLVAGSVPQGSGLSSSSALVVASALALLALWGVPASPAQVAEFTCRCERFVGTQGGGMDQAASLMGQAQVALHVEFNPLRTHPVHLPPGGVFVVANCLAPSHKADTAATRFNRRVLECRLATMLLAKHLADRSLACTGNNSSPSSSNLPDFRTVKVLQELEQALLEQTGSSICQSAGSSSSNTRQGQLEQAVQQLLPHASYTLEQVTQQLGISLAELMALLPAALQAAAVPAAGLLLQQRARHVYSEAGRVLQFRAVCEQSDASPGDKLVALGGLMDASHASCARLYQCSCDELDQLVATAKAAGALGARLTGAGWGGCVVALVRGGDVDAFMARVQQEYFAAPAVAARLVESQMTIGQCLFQTMPCQGAECKLMDV